MLGVLGDEGLQLGQPRRAIGVGGARLGGDPLQQRHAGIDIRGVGADPSLEGGPDPVVGQVRQQGQRQLAEHLAAGFRGHLVV